jgi:hypothetical protein
MCLFSSHFLTKRIQRIKNGKHLWDKSIKKENIFCVAEQCMHFMLNVIARLSKI